MTYRWLFRRNIYFSLLLLFDSFLHYLSEISWRLSYRLYDRWRISSDFCFLWNSRMFLLNSTLFLQEPFLILTQLCLKIIFIILCSGLYLSRNNRRFIMIFLSYIEKAFFGPPRFCVLEYDTIRSFFSENRL